MWELYALTGAFGQALAWALKKKIVAPNTNLLLGFVTYTTAGIGFTLIWLLQSNSPPTVTETFWWASLWVIGFNLLAAWCAFKALDKAAYSDLMAFIPVTTLLIVPLEWWLTGNIPNSVTFFGIGLMVIGGVVFGLRRNYTPASWSVIGLFSITLCSYAIASTYMKVMQTESGDSWFSATVMHVGIAIGFALLITLHSRREYIVLKSTKLKTIRWMMLAGLTTVALENGPIFLALSESTASEVFALKRLMPIFALGIGYLWLQERLTPTKIIGACLMIAAGVIVSLTT
jgi:drug/metabolite transporter (DMT)-like permease